MKIIISGPPGSGKSSVAKILSSKLSIKYVSAGLIFRDLAKRMNIDIVKLNKLAEDDFEIDKKIDLEMFKLIKSQDNVIIESHIGGWLFHNLSDLSIYLRAPLDVRTKRIASRDHISEDEAIIQIIKRERSHRERFLRYYGIDILDLSVFDLVINTSYLLPEDVADIILGVISRKNLHSALSH
ncbi:cytidylate kinase [Sulfolobus acidocaldarius SUSAZ]|nr:cytidylate kinase [Sulfolobus acidocaldarius SUSAZ]